MRRFFAPQKLAVGQSAVLSGSDAAHISRVLRLKTGDVIAVFDGKGHAYECRLETVAPDGVTVTRRRDDETLFSVDAAITGVRAAVAETGTLVCSAGSQSARGSSLIPPIHIALVDARQLHADLFDLFDWLGQQDELPSNVNLITGPSKTADIEGVLVTGVHGPGVVHIVLVNG